MLLCGLRDVERVQTTVCRPVISSLLLLELVELPSLLTQLLGQCGVFAPGLWTKSLWLILKELECW